MKGKKKYLFNLFLKHSTTGVILVYLLINIVFMRTLWKQIIFDHSSVGAVYGEIYATEWHMEKVYQNIIHFKNPFEQSKSMLYPFGTNFISTDSGNGILFVFLRPFLSTHQSLYVLTALALFFANVGMYMLLRILRIDKLLAFLIGLSFGYMTFIQPRLGHITYFFFYTFPWFYYSILAVYKSKKTAVKIIATLSSSLLLVWTLYLNLYFFVTLLVSIGFFLSYFIVFYRKLFFEIIRSYFNYIILFAIACIIFLAPWLAIFYETYLFEDLPKTPGFGGAIEFSSDLFGYFIPSGYSIFLGPVGVFFGTHFSFASGIFENFSYPGIIILSSFLILIPLWYFKKISSELKKRILPFFWTSIGFWILTLGPFLHVFGKWGITVDDGIRIVFPLPYILFHYLPFMNNIRSPGRLMPAFIFFGYIVSAFLITYFLRKKTLRFKQFIYSVLVLIIIIDHYVVVPNPLPVFQPKKIYNFIRNDPRNITVMEIPFVVRDGFMYFGDICCLDFLINQPFHGKNILGGYMGRFPYYKRAYYMNNPFLGYIGRLIDPDIKNNGSLERTDQDLQKWKKLDIKTSIDTLDFLNLGYILVNTNMPYAVKAENALRSVGYTVVMKEDRYDLWYRKPVQRDFLSVNVGSTEDAVYLGQGWSTREDGFRWSGKKMSVMFNVAKSNTKKLYFTASTFHKPQSVSVYLDKQKIGTVQLSTALNTYSIPLKENIDKGIHTFTFLFDTYYLPSKVLPNNTDDRQISAKFTNIRIQ